jgi:hypothetical protein
MKKGESKMLERSRRRWTSGDGSGKQAGGLASERQGCHRSESTRETSVYVCSRRKERTHGDGGV